MTNGGIAALEARIDYRFAQPELLTTALTHPSYGGDHRVPHYQRLEFLGDAVLELACSRLLYLQNPDAPEGQLTRMRAQLVREETLARVAQDFALGSLVRLSQGEQSAAGDQRPSILCDVVEAVLGAVFLDGGFEAAAKVADCMLAPYRADVQSAMIDNKSRLQEILQRERGRMPEYELIGSTGPAHQPTFEVCVRIAGEIAGRGVGGSIRAAQQDAAREAILRMQNQKD